MRRAQLYSVANSQIRQVLRPDVELTWTFSSWSPAVPRLSALSLIANGVSVGLGLWDYRVLPKSLVARPASPFAASPILPALPVTFSFATVRICRRRSRNNDRRPLT